MRFQFYEEAEMTKAVIREFAEQEAAPGACSRDEQGLLDRVLFRKLGELGVTGILLPEEDGGSGTDFVAYAILIEELSRVCASTARSVSAHAAYMAWPVSQFGTETQKKELLDRLSACSMIGTTGALPVVTADHPRFIPEDAVLAVEDGEGYRLNGRCSCLANADEASHYIIYAAAGSGSRRRSCTAFLIEKGTAGFSVQSEKDRLGLRASQAGVISLSDCRVPRTSVLGRPGQGHRIVEQLFAVGAVSSAAQAVGIAQGAFEAAASYAKERKQFGQPIIRQQAISFKLSDMAVQIEASRLLLYQAAWRLNERLPGDREAALARAFAADTAAAVTIEAVQIFGGYGYIREYAVERYMRDAKCVQAECGNERQRLENLLRIMASKGGTA